MSRSEINRQKTRDYQNRVAIVLSSMPPMTSNEFYAQMAKSMGVKSISIVPNSSGSSKAKRFV